MRALSLVIACTAALVGCYHSGVELETKATQLEAVTTCEDLLGAIQADATAKVDHQVNAFIEGYHQVWGGFGFEEDFAAGPPQNAGSDAEAPGPDGFSETNTQVAGVDEADIVKVGDNGQTLYTVRGNGFYVFDAWPPPALSRMADVEIEGEPIEMFVEGDRAVVFSATFDVTDDGDRDDCYFPHPFAEPGIATADVAIAPGCYRSFVKTTQIDLSGDRPTVDREFYVEGYYTSSRRHDDIVRAVTQTYLRFPTDIPDMWAAIYTEPYPDTREEMIARAKAWAPVAKEAIAKTTLEQWLPVWGERVNGEFVESPAPCGFFYVPEPGLTDYGMTQIAGFDMGADRDVVITSILGAASHVYANHDSLVLAQPDYTWNWRGANEDRSAVHLFSVSADHAASLYVDSAFVEGVVQDQFSIDVKDNVLRLATTRTKWPEHDPNTDLWIPPVTDNVVTTFAASDASLSQIGQTPSMAEGERIFSARFVGDIAYVVTFRQVDPLFVVDLSPAERPRVIGELKIPGFSDYMHPLGDDHLLTIGRDIDEETQRDNGTALQIFDVSNPTDPKLAHKTLVGEGYSEANHNHKAFNYYAAKGLLAFPFANYSRGFSSTLELYRVDVDAGFSRLGAVDHSELAVKDCGGQSHGGVDEFYQECGYLPQVTRGVFIDDFIYTLSFGGVTAHSMGDLQEPVGTATY